MKSKRRNSRSLLRRTPKKGFSRKNFGLKTKTFLTKVKSKEEINSIVQKLSQNRKQPHKKNLDQTVKKADFCERDASKINIMEYCTYEYLYFRDSRLSNMTIHCLFLNLRLIDVSCNRLKDLKFLYYMPNIVHVFASCNLISSFLDIFFCSKIETLGLCNNRISSFEGFQSLPKLKLLNVVHNNIKTLECFPTNLTKLEVINLSNNPISKSKYYIPVVLSLLYMTSPSLKKIDDYKISPKDISKCKELKGKLLVCANSGFLPDYHNPNIPVSQQIDDFLLRKSVCESNFTPLRVIELKFTSFAQENELLEISLICKVMLKNLKTNPIRLPMGLCVKKFLIQSGAKAVELVINDNIVVQMDRSPKLPEFSAVLLLPGGKYSYQYKYDGKLQNSNSFELKYNKNEEKNDIKYGCGINIDWYIETSQGCYKNIKFDPPEMSLKPSKCHVYQTIKVVVSLIDLSQRSILTQVELFSDPVLPCKPGISHCEIVGDTYEGEILTCKYEYVGGKEGRTKVLFYRQNFKETTSREKEYLLSNEDVGSKIICEFTPVRFDGKCGDVQILESGVIKVCRPTVKKIGFTGNMMQNEEISVNYEYYGGEEGQSIVEWYRMDPKLNQFKYVSNGRSFKLSLLDISSQVKIVIIPINTEGLKGKKIEQALPKIKPAFPKITKINIENTSSDNANGDFLENNILRVNVDYVGGIEGNSKIEWYRISNEIDEVEKKVINEYINCKTCKISKEEIGFTVGVRYFPVRVDGCRGEKVKFESLKIIKSSTPTCLSISIEGNAIAGEKVKCLTLYHGGKECKNVGSYQWYRQYSNNAKRLKLKSQKEEIMCTSDDIGHRLMCEYIPIRKDGLKCDKTFVTFSEPIFAE